VVAGYLVFLFGCMGCIGCKGCHLDTLIYQCCGCIL